MARMTYEETMAWGACQYRDVTEALAQAGLRAEFTQTGGMCAAIEVPLDGGHYLLLTDFEEHAVVGPRRARRVVVRPLRT